MTPEQYVYWLHGWSEINGAAPPTAAQWIIINDHLDLVFDKVTPDRSAPAVVTGSKSVTVPAAPLPVSGLSMWSLASENAGKIFITISREPIFDPKLTYSYYQYSKNWQDRFTDDPTTKSLLTGLGIRPVGEKVYVVVDNSLQPTKPTYADNMKGSSNHLTMLPHSGPGIINVGTSSPLIC